MLGLLQAGCRAHTSRASARSFCKSPFKNCAAKATPNTSLDNIMTVIDTTALRAACAAHPKPAEFTPSYGTAGFRAEASLLPSTVFRCGLLIGLRARATGQACGVMITASHNPEADNGVKLVEPSGEMLQPDWEAHATQLAQATTDDELVSLVTSLAAASTTAAAGAHSDAATAAMNGVDTAAADAPPPPPPPAAAAAAAAAPGPGRPKVLIGRDTRPSGEGLAAACRAGVQAVGVQVLDVGVVTTPELHFCVQTYNAYHTVEEAAYFTNLLASYRSLTSGSPPAAQPVHVDCANGVGALKLQQMLPALRELGLQLVLYNAGGGRLNHECGADYVQKEQTYPAGMGDVPAGATCASLDGDADRIVFFTKSPSSGAFVLLDGDKIAALAAVCLRQLLSHAPAGLADSVQIGVVQTAYANGASTRFLTDRLGLKVGCTNTGVKYLHHEAKVFDVGIYFESNGHGTVLFRPALLQRLQDMDEQVSIMQLLAVSRLMNQAVGDALSGLLLCDAVLRSGTSLGDWQGLYHDLPSRQLKLVVADRGAITTTDAERRCVTPPGLQEVIDAAVARYPQGRAFARPSGTEDAVRVYAEAETQAAADGLAREVAQLVYDRAGGTGSRP